jgi:hypothetical protein
MSRVRTSQEVNMRKKMVLGSAIVVILFCSTIAFAQGSDEKNQFAVGEKIKEKQVDKERMGGIMTQMMGATQKQMVAINDGGVVVMVGNKLFKYDKDLNLIKEAELKISVGPNQEMLKK